MDASVAATPQTRPSQDTHDPTVTAAMTPGANENAHTTMNSHFSRKDELDTCRICRGEGSLDEPLFYPCKCSGSIKYVHQDCLMEWLSHSQKKYCELCKTPFRFTKLYSPHMPSRLPTGVFMRKASIHILEHLATWLRGALVGCVWLVCVPWLMRCIWRIIFWIGDVGWARDGMYIWPLLAAATDDKVVVAVGDMNVSGRVHVPNATFQTPTLINTTSPVHNLSQDPLVFKLARGLFTTMVAPLRRSDPLVFKANVTINPLIARMLEQSHSSILSEVQFLKTMSSSPFINRFVMDVVEGQIITLSVVVVCILIFLIREWVVQQQPVVDLAAADAVNALAQAGGGIQNQQDERLNDVDGAGAEPHQEATAAALAAPPSGAEVIEESDNIIASNVEDPEQEVERMTRTDTPTTVQDCESSIRSLSDSLSMLERARAMLVQLEGGVESLFEPSRSEIRDMRAKTQSLEREILAELRKLKALLKDFFWDSAELSVMLDELFRRIEGIAPDDENRNINVDVDDRNDDTHLEEKMDGRQSASMPEWNHASLAIDIARKMQEFADSIPRARRSSEQAELQFKEPWGRSKSLEKRQEEIEDERGSKRGVDWKQIPRADQSQRQSRTQAENSSAQQYHEPLVGFSEIADNSNMREVDEKVPNGTFDGQDDLSWVSTTGSSDARMTIEELPENPSAPDYAEGSTPSTTLAAQTGSELSTTPSTDAGQFPEAELGFLGWMVHWFWGDIQQEHLANAQDPEVEFGAADDEHVVRDLAAEAPFVPFQGAQPFQQDVRNDRDQVEAPARRIPLRDAPPPADEAVAAAAALGAEANGLDADAIDDAEDLEGILELIGMQGPLAGLLQNAIFSGILISLSIMLFVFLPYVLGKLVLLHIAEPSLLYKVPLKTATVIADLAIDAGVMIGGYVAYAALEGYRWVMGCLAVDMKERGGTLFVNGVRGHAKAALERLVGGLIATNEIEAGDLLYLSMACHAALHAVEDWAISEVKFLFDAVKSIFSCLLSADVLFLYQQLKGISLSTANLVIFTLQSIWTIICSFYTTGSIHLPTGTPLHVPDDPMLTYWNARDRFLAVLAGYAAIGLLCGLYVKLAPLTTSHHGKRFEAHIVEACLQAGGVLKVILIISIEMIVFPLFCGFLLDFALLPLFENATLSSRVAFTVSSPWTSGFVHWFVGTCYMFHFALFVSMCRRILRKGVLYFIRDPDDPTFHPVRDVLERNVVTQLRKIAFSAIVYGALIVVCLGGIVWGLWAALDGILPIHWSSTGSNIEFPLDILFYNFLTPFVVHYAKPSAGITAMYEWWFRRVARALRLSDFLFREEHFDEEGHWVRHTWKAWITRRVNNDLTEEDVDRLAISQGTADADALDDGIVKFVPDGQYVRAPASDQVRIPKGTPVFVPVTVENKRLDGKPDDEGVHAANSNLVIKVYIPPWFKLRIGLFILAVWIFAAATGIAVTVLPLLLGRYLLSSAFGRKEFINDIYAFSIGIYLLGGALYAGIHRHAIISWLVTTFIPADGGRHIIGTVWNTITRVASIIYVYSTLAIGLPLINAVLLEVYILMPIHYFFHAGEHHVMHLVQDWTLGILYVRIGMRIFLSDPESRPARAIRQVFANGYLNPDAGRATRYFILPALLCFATLMGAPFATAFIVNKTYMRAAEKDDKIATMRMAYPLASAIVVAVLAGRTAVRAARRWKARIRDEVYLVGERLHNFGDKKSNKGKEKVKSPQQEQ
ncbi:uncharacterized protein PV09_04286 [Verruconis gallopava]|uniref:RING-type E3 ubiquitin transferase n=1 Tax=Verruconis gallopava TaxID=253628 RepID=A0A0D1YV69_9PEZI|nr:uncharacterized protein PV09_04286 [Verruconis gallopava]KIW04532.1 hypothetical protein PV09_04286 [Verruconis gallopava]